MIDQTSRTTILTQATPRDVAQAAAVICAGGTIGFPTETVYGLGADATVPEAVARIYAAKGRPSFNPLIAHVAGRGAAEAEGVFSRRASMLAEAFWPGPLTLVLPRRAAGRVCDLACAGLATIAIRVPAHPVALALLRAVDRPVAAPSANRSGHVSPTQACHVLEDLSGHVDIVLDGGPCSIGLESTIIACDGDAIILLRAGGIPQSAIEAVIGHVAVGDGQAVRAPGMLASHYAPHAALRLAADKVERGELGLDFGSHFGSEALDLSPNGDLQEAAANLYRHIRQLDSTRAAIIAVAPVPEHGLGEAINDRLRRAAAPRD